MLELLKQAPTAMAIAGLIALGILDQLTPGSHAVATTVAGALAGWLGHAYVTASAKPAAAP